MTDTTPLTGEELAEIKARALDAAADEDAFAYFTRQDVLEQDVPRLVAEVERLRAAVDRAHWVIGAGAMQALGVNPPA